MTHHRDDDVTVVIDRLSYGGRGVGRLDGYVVFVPDTAPGDHVRARLVRAKRDFAEAALLEVLEPAPSRVVPPCPHFGPCGGCVWQHLPYAEQLSAKEAIVRDSLRHIAGLDAPVRPIVGMETPWAYRNKMEFTFHPDGVLGLHRRGAFDRIVGLEACLLPGPIQSEIVREMRAFVIARNLLAYHPRTREGVLRQLVIREGQATGDAMVGVVTVPQPGETVAAALRDLAQDLADRHPQIRSVVWAENGAASDVLRVDRSHVLSGVETIRERLAGFEFAIGLETFFQTNTRQAERIVQVVLDQAELAGGEQVIDLYCGVGALTLPLARRAAHVHGIEVVDASVRAARRNAAANGVENVSFVHGDVRHALPAVAAEVGAVDLVVLDPPRAGAGGKVMRRVGRTGARRIVYVSCNPTTLAGDLRELAPFGYRIAAVQPVDLFPHTHHVETVLLLERGEA